jgi:tetratricopeptide (TPR) repeat protein
MMIPRGGAMKKRRACCHILKVFVVCSLVAAIPQEIFAQSKKGLELFNSWKFQEAEKAFREALQADPKDTPTNFYLGLSLLLQGKNGDALDVFLKVKSSQDRADQRTRPAIPSEFQIQLALARARLGLKQYPEAWKNLESARIEDGKSSDVYVYRGVFYLQQEKNPEALQELQKAISLDQKNPYAYYYQGLAYFHSGEAQKAVDALKMFLSLAPDAPEADEAKQIVAKLC